MNYIDIAAQNKGYKCRLCDECRGDSCIGELPGMGGVFNNANFQANCRAWDKYDSAAADDVKAKIRLAPVTGSVENIGYPDEKEFYFDIVDYCLASGIDISIGDGVPDEKLKFGIEALYSRKTKGAVFIKPYGNERIFERIEWSTDVAEAIGVDIDSYNIITMRDKAKLEKKTSSQLLDIKKSLSVPFIIKGVFNKEDIDLVKAVRPDIVVISNHGGRVETRLGSTIDFLSDNFDELRRSAGEVWIDGGVRSEKHLRIASEKGATTVMLGRPLISALLRNKTSDRNEEFSLS